MSFEGIVSDQVIRTLRRRYSWVQRWSNVVMLHWRVPTATLSRHVATGLEIDELDGASWISLVIFRLNVRPAWLPFRCGFSDMAEVNLRTYVRCRDQPGITFLSVHADNRLAMFIAKLLTPMPYQWANISYQSEMGEEPANFSASRPPGFRLAFNFRTTAAEAEAPEGTLDSWLLERYTLFLPDRGGSLLRADVSHPRWQVRGIDLGWGGTTAGAAFGIDLTRAPDMVHFSTGVESCFGQFRRLLGLSADQIPTKHPKAPRQNQQGQQTETASRLG